MHSINYVSPVKKNSDPIIAQYVCMWNHQQSGYDMKHLTHIPSRASCARVCHDDAECIGFEYYPAGNRDCYLTKTPWQTVQPVANGGKWGCENKDGNQELLFLVFIFFSYEPIRVNYWFWFF